MRVELRGIRKEFRSLLRGKVEALKGVNFWIEEGEFFVILGPSGCGKSTLLNIVAGLEDPTSGEVWIGGKLVARPGFSLPPKERGVAVVFQSYALYPHMSVRENIAFPLKVAGLEKKEIERRVQEVASMLGIENLLEARPSELSGGEKQRVAIGRAIVKEPSVLLLDEPLSNLDAQLRLKTKEEIKRLQRELGITTLYVTHDQSEAMTLADRMAVMREGKLEQVGEPMEVYKYPANSFVASFVGTPPMNVFKRKVLTVKGRRFVKLFGLELEVETEMEEVFIGFRPEEAGIEEEGDLEVIMVERLGDETLVHLSCGGERAVVKLHGDHTVEPGKKVGLILKSYHVFED